MYLEKGLSETLSSRQRRIPGFRSMQTRFVGEVGLLGKDSGNSLFHERASDAKHIRSRIVSTRLTGMQHYGMKIARTQEIGKTFSRDWQLVALFILPEQETTIGFVIPTMPNIVDHMWLETHKDSLDTLRCNDILHTQV